jgi:hypothetical protein
MGAQAAPTAGPMQLLRMTDGLIIQQSLYAAARLGIADVLKDGERTSAELATVLQVKEDALYRVLRFLSGEGVFRETAMRRFANSTLSEYLRTDVPGSIRSILIFRGGRFYFSSFGDFPSSVETGLPAREKALGTDGFEYLRRDTEEARIFDDAMTAISALWAPDIATAYDFGSWGSLMDVAGGNGLLLAAILSAHSGLRGVLADQAHVLKRARERGLLSGELADRVQFEPADFFQAVPPGCRAYIMKNILHDWDDRRARQILLNCRRAIPDDGVLLLVEYWLGEENAPSLGKTIDMVMLAVTGGKERTVSEHSDLLAGAGFQMTRIIPVRNEVMILEAKPA